MYGPRFQLFFLLLALGTCQHYVVVSGWLFAGTLKTTETLYYVGENLIAYCTKESGFTGEVGFQKGNMAFNQMYVTKLNSTYAVLNAPVTDNDPDETTLTCIEDDRTVASTSVYTDYAPQNASDLRMVWLDEANLTITWGYSNIPYKNQHSERLITVSGEWAYSLSGIWNKCYSGKLPEAACEVKDITNPFAEVFIRVNITNVKRHDTVTTVFPGVSIREHVKPLPVGSVVVNALDSRTARVNVTASKAELAYNITVYETSGKEAPSFVIKDKTSKKWFDITNLHPSYTYKFEVRSKYDLDRGYYSDPVNSGDLTMPEDAPSAAPVVMPGSFYRPLCSASENHTVAYIYFQELDDKDKNGKIVNYTATVVRDGQPVTYTQSGSPRTIKLSSVPCSGQFEVRLRASTAVGSSPPFLLHVPVWDQVNKGNIDKLKMMIKSSDTGIQAEWQPTPSMPGVTFLLYYCRKYSPDTDMCSDSIQYVNISTETGSQLLPSADANMKFGVAAISQDSTTNGIQFTQCLYDPTKGGSSTMSQA